MRLSRPRSLGVAVGSNAGRKPRNTAEAPEIAAGVAGLLSDPLPRSENSDQKICGTGRVGLSLIREQGQQETPRYGHQYNGCGPATAQSLIRQGDCRGAVRRATA